MIYEQRVYSCLPGQLPRLLSRFEDHTISIWEKHGIRPVGFWTVLVGDGSNHLHYLLAWDSLADREKKWSAFVTDPAWQAVRIESEKPGQIVANISNMMLTPTTFSALK